MQSFIEKELGSKQIISTAALTRAGSNRQYYRIVTKAGSYIACENSNINENESFFYFSHFFYQKNIPVPQVFYISEDRTKYILNDLGHITLLDLIIQEGHSEKVYELYQGILQKLAEMQIKASADIDYGKCFAAKQFDAQMALADLNYFKYYFLDFQKIDYDKQALQQELDNLSHAVGNIEELFFMFRDFQGRNIMIQENRCYFIDFQGGMKGPLQYDVASLLWQAKAELPLAWKNDLYAYYKSEVKQYIGIDEVKFDRQYSYLLLVRLLQVLGAYGLRGLIERRPHFLSSIPHGLQNIATWLKLYNLNDYPILHSLLQIITHVNLIESYQIPQANGNTKLKVLVQSFSYKIGGIPKDESDNGGGFVFDCRGVLNPGRFEEYKKLTGRDAPVIEFLETKTKVHDFLQGVKQVIDISIEDYLQRGFDSLMISFGCTGGQHRSVYCADVIATYLQEKYQLQVEVKHVRQEEKAWVN